MRLADATGRCDLADAIWQMRLGRCEREADTRERQMRERDRCDREADTREGQVRETDEIEADTREGRYERGQIRERADTRERQMRETDAKTKRRKTRGTPSPENVLLRNLEYGYRLLEETDEARREPLIFLFFANCNTHTDGPQKPRFVMS